MDAQSFDELTRGMARPTRRATLRLLAGAALVPLLPAETGGALAGAPVPTCVPDGARCGKATDLTCCSGLCKRKKHSRKRACKPAPDQGVCTTLANRCTGDTTVCGTGLGGDCRCYVSLAGLSVCGNEQYYCPSGDRCVKDADCHPVSGFGSYCVQGGGGCPGDSCSDSFCVPSCDQPL
jgi:hypothetical protein